MVVFVMIFAALLTLSSIGLSAGTHQPRQLPAASPTVVSPSNSTPAAGSNSPEIGWLANAKNIVAFVGGIVGLVGGVMGIWSALRPPKIDVAHTDHIGVVVSPDGTTSRVHLPLVFSNLAKKPGVVTLLRLLMRPVGGGEGHEYEWGLFWKEGPDGARSRERRPSPVPVPGFTCVERNLQFDCPSSVTWKPQLYEFELHVRVGRGRTTKQVSRFYSRPSKERCALWYSKPKRAEHWVDDLSTFTESSQVPEGGV